jgi:hypothetical protein
MFYRPMRGMPVYRGTRIPVELIADMLNRGASVDEILEGYPALDGNRTCFSLPAGLSAPGSASFATLGKTSSSPPSTRRSVQTGCFP